MLQPRALENGLFNYRFFLAAHLAFIISDMRLRAAGLIPLRPGAFFDAGLVIFAGD
jgi:hypothetical protein